MITGTWRFFKVLVWSGRSRSTGTGIFSLAEPEADTPDLATLQLKTKLIIQVLVIFDEFPAKLGPGTRSNGSGSKRGVERT